MTPRGSRSSDLEMLVGRYDPKVFTPKRPLARVRLRSSDAAPIDVLIRNGTAELVATDTSKRPDASLSADDATWSAITHDLGGGMAAFRAGRLSVRHDLHLGVGFLAATAGAAPGQGLRFRQLQTAAGSLSVTEAGSGPPVLLLHGLGATKVSLLPTVAALANGNRAIAVDLPGFGDSDKPLSARYDAAYFASAMTALLDTLEIERADIVGNSMGGRVAIEMGLTFPRRVKRLGLLAPSLAWLRERRWAPYLRLLPPQLGAIQPAPRPVVEGIVRRLIPGAKQGWTAAGVDEFLRSYLRPRGRAAFYAAARNIYLEEPHGPGGFWTRLPELEPPSLFIWGKRDPIVPIRFAHHVQHALPAARHLELDCGHVPQLERPRETHEALRRFLDSPS
jgi:pimeloyl-ACP methyl ester carboxylesterase